MHYPPADRLDLLETLHGRPVADPYRWLEDPADPATAAWQAAQDSLARTWLDALPGRDGAAARLRTLLDAGLVDPPAVRGDRSFFLRRDPGQEHAVLVVREEGEAAAERVLVDPAALSPDGTITLDQWMPSIEGNRIAIWLSEGGDEEAVLRIHDVATMAVLDGPIGRVRYCGLGWLPEGDAFFYGRRLDAADVPEGEELFHRRVWLRRIGTPVSADRLVFGAGRDKTEYHGIDVSRDGRWLVVTASLGTAPRNDAYLAALPAADPNSAGASDAGIDLRPITEGLDAQSWPAVEDDGRLYVLTDLGAPRRRLCVADPTTPAPEHWADLIPETPDAVLEGYIRTGDALVVHRSRWALSELTVHDPSTGAERGAIPLPPGTVAGLSTRPDGGDEVWIGWTDHVTPPLVRHHRISTGQTTTWAEAAGHVPVEGVRTEQVWFPSADGTQVPMFLLHTGDRPAAGDAPTQLYGYGGFNVALTPAYSASILAWVEAGGVYAVANLRGGSEGGEEWHRDGMRANKQHVFDDFIAAAEWLIDRRITSPEHLCIAGGSNGGLLVGAALTQRPDLFAAVHCSAPLLDMVRYERFGLGTTWKDEHGTAEDPEELGWLLAYSPYHRVAQGTPYPATLLTLFDSDTRVDPLHGRKLCAALQWATSAAPDRRPILVRRESQVGHGARSVSRTVDLTTDAFCFLAGQVGLHPSWAR